jgi:phosphatidylglycerol lysyltransferase
VPNTHRDGSRKSEGRSLVPWIGPLAALVVFGIVAYVLHLEVMRLHFSSVLAHLTSIPRAHVLAALGLTTVSYWALSGYDLLALRYLRKRLRYGRVLFTSFIASSFGHTLGFAAFTGGAIRFRLYGTAGVTAIEVATISAFSSLSIAIGLATIAGISLFLSPAQTALVLHLERGWTRVLGALLLATVASYALWATLARGALEIRGWALRAPGPGIGLPQMALGVTDMTLAGSVLWWLLPARSHVAFMPFMGAYAIAVIAGIVSHVPGGIGVFETVILLMLRSVPPDALLGSLLAYRAVYYLVPLLFGATLFGYKEISAQRSRFARARERAAEYVAPVAPQICGALTFLGGTLLLVADSIPAVSGSLAALTRHVPLALLNAASLAASLIGLALLVLSRALFRRVQAAWRLSLWLLVAGIAASLLENMLFEVAAVLALVLVVLALGKRAFYRPSAILDERFTPAWAASIAGALMLSIWVGLLVYRGVPYSPRLWSTFGPDAQAARMLRASLAALVLGTAWLLVTLLRPSRPEPAVASAEDLARARAVIRRSDASLANAALTGDKRLLFGDAGDSFLMYRIAGESWIALGDPVGPSAGTEELVWRFREMSERHGGRTVLYQTGSRWLSLYLDLGLAPLKIGEEARVPLPEFSLERPARADLRASHRRAQSEGLGFFVAPPPAGDALIAALAPISASWLERKRTGEKRFNVGSFARDYLRNFPLAVVHAGATPLGFAVLWPSGTRAELGIDLMRFRPEAPAGTMDYLIVELMRWGCAQGFGELNLGMAPLTGLDQHPLAPAWHRVGNFVFRHGEHFHNFEGLRQYKLRFDPLWEPRYLVARGGIALPRVLIEISRLIGGGARIDDRRDVT